MTKGSRKKKTIGRRGLLAILLVSCFCISLGIYFARSIRSTQYENAVYANMEEPTFPVLYAILDGMAYNPMRGHLQNMGNEAADTLSILPEDRKLEIHVQKYGNSIVGLSYEIRNLRLDHFIEKTEVTSFEEVGDTLTALLPIQNLIERDNPYLLCITLDTGGRKVNYYTKILWPTATTTGTAFGGAGAGSGAGAGGPASSMLALALEFNSKTFDYEEARSLTQYMETDPKALNDSLGTVTIGSSFTELTWGETGMQPDGAPELYLREFQGMTGDIEVIYRTKTENAAGTETYVNTDHFSMRTGAERIYIMNYRRRTYEVFSATKHRFAGKMIMLGITDPEVLSTKTSENGQYIAFKSDKELWCYDQKNMRAVNVFSFRSEKDDGVRSLCRDHDLKILAVSDTGVLDFVVYGYMNRGRHEGLNGLVYYSYNPESDIITENFFVPFETSYEKIKNELSGLCAKGSGDMFYFKQSDTVFAIDLKSLEMMEVVSGLSADTYASSGSQNRFAFVENGRYESDSVKVMNIVTGSTQSIDAQDGEVLQILTFNDDDIVIGTSGAEDKWYINGRLRSMPFYRLQIYDEDLNEIKKYEKPGLWLDDFEKTDNRFLFNLYKKRGTGTFVQESADTIVCSGGGESADSLLFATTSGEKQKVYCISVAEEVKNTKKMTVEVPESISYENSGNVEIRAEKSEKDMLYYAFEHGHLKGVTARFSDALDLCYENYGIIKDKNGAIIYARADRGNFHTIRDSLREAGPAEEDLVIDAREADLNEVLNFVYYDHPVTVEHDDGSKDIIYGYDAKIVKILHPETGETETVPREEFGSGNFICFTSLAK